LEEFVKRYPNKNEEGIRKVKKKIRGNGKKKTT
jgi:hypothetical protein